MSMAIILGIEPEIIKMAPAANTVRMQRSRRRDLMGKIDLFK
jgi:hypothetical protein